MNFIFEKRLNVLGLSLSLFDCLLIAGLCVAVKSVAVAEWIGFVVLIIAVILHEVAHGLMAYFLGDPTAKDKGRLSLNPFVHVDPLGTVILPVMLVLSGTSFLFGWAKPVPVNPQYFKKPLKGMMWVALAGPAVNIVLAWISSICLKVLVLNQVFEPGHIVIQSLFGSMMINLVLAIFNMIPIPPLDGSRVMMVLLPEKLQRFWFELENYGLFIVMGLVYFGAFDGILMKLLNLSMEMLLK